MSRLYKSTLFSKSESGSNLLLSISIWDNASFIDSTSAFVNLISVAQISLSWVLAQKDFIVPIPGTTKLERLKENIKATEIKFTKAEVESMNEALSQMDIESRRFEPDSDFEKRVDL